jgi:hypothetical protein
MDTRSSVAPMHSRTKQQKHTADRSASLPKEKEPPA